MTSGDKCIMCSSTARHRVMTIANGKTTTLTLCDRHWSAYIEMNPELSAYCFRTLKDQLESGASEGQVTNAVRQELMATSKLIKKLGRLPSPEEIDFEVEHPSGSSKDATISEELMRTLARIDRVVAYLDGGGAVAKVWDVL